MSESNRPWHGTAWDNEAQEANTAMGGQGYVVDAMMRASAVGTRLTYAIIVLMIVQIAAAVVPILRCGR